MDDHKMIWWISDAARIRKDEKESSYDVIRISRYGSNYKVWKVHNSEYYNYTLLIVTDSLETALMYGLEYIGSTQDEYR